MAAVAAIGRTCLRRLPRPGLGDAPLGPLVGASLAAVVCGGICSRVRSPDQTWMVRVAGADSGWLDRCRAPRRSAEASGPISTLLPSAGHRGTVAARVY